jgi:hypothetical protein
MCAHHARVQARALKPKHTQARTPRMHTRARAHTHTHTHTHIHTHTCKAAEAGVGLRGQAPQLDGVGLDNLGPRSHLAVPDEHDLSARQRAWM